MKVKAKKFVLFFSLLVLAIPLSVQAQEFPTRFEHISIEQGLSQVTVYCILQDSRGFMWFGTEDGLNRYNGYTFAVYKRDPQDPHSLSTNTIRSIYEDSSGRLWVGTDGGGLDEFDRTTQQFIHHRHDPNDPNSLSHNTVTAIQEDAAGMLWIGTNDGLNRLDPATGQFVRYQHDPDEPNSLSHDGITDIQGDLSGTLWIATYGGGLNQFDPVTEQFVHYQHDPVDPNSLSHDQVTTLTITRNGELWIGSMGGLDTFDAQAHRFSHYVHDPDDVHSLSDNGVTKIIEDASGTLWIGTIDGLNEFDRQTEEFIRYQNDPLDPYSLGSNEVYSLYEDTSNVLWIGLDFGGLNKLDRKTRRFVHYQNVPEDPHSLDSDTVYAIHEDSSDTLWIGTVSGGLNRLDRSTGRFVHYQPDPKDPHSLSSAAALAIYEDSLGVLWVGTWNGGVNRLDPEEPRRTSGHFVHYRHDPNDPYSLGGDAVLAIYEDSSGALWFGTYLSGLDRFDRETERFTHYRHDPNNISSISSDNVLTIYEDRAGTLWVGTEQGLNRFDRQTEQFERFENDPDDPKSLSSNAVAVIFEDSTGTLWIGTDDGLDRFDRDTETFIHYTEKDGLASDAVAGILADDKGNLWISSNKGLSKFDPRTEEFKNYDARDGLQSNEFNRGAYCNSKSGEMFFGGVNGFTAFYPADVVDNPHVPPIVVTNFRIFNKPIGIGGDSPLKKPIEETKEITLSYRDYVFSFEFAALDYSIPEKNRYAYMLEGFDRDWNYVGSIQRFASYANLPAGTYTFLVKGSNNDGVWNETGTSIKIIITPPPWRTWWAYTLYALAAALAVAAYVRYRTREVERKHLEQTTWAVQEERDRIAALLESRRQLVATLSHDLRTPVAVVRGHLESTWGNGEKTSPLPRRKLRVVLQELDRLGALLDDLFTLSRLEVDQLALSLVPTEIVALAQRAVSAMRTPAWRKGKVQVVLEAADSEVWAMADGQRLMQVLMNLLHNAVRHTLPGGVVAVSVEGRPDDVAICVHDTGEGIHPDDLPCIWERFYHGQSQAGGGAGLGLALVKELTEAMGGTVAVESTLGEGSCFTITLPHADPEHMLQAE
jgi:two-component system sensor histidine kinase ChiS